MRRNRLIEGFRGWCPKDSLRNGSKELASYKLTVRRSLGNILLYVGNLIAICGSLFVLKPVIKVSMFIDYPQGYKGPTYVHLWGVHPGVFLMTAIGSILALVGVFTSSKKRLARMLMGIGCLLVLSHSVIGLLGYYEHIRIFGWLMIGLAWDQPKPIVYTGYFNLTVFGLVALIIGGLIIGGSMYSDRIMAFVKTYIT
jgi:hypothetical protein